MGSFELISLFTPKGGLVMKKVFLINLIVSLSVWLAPAVWATGTYHAGDGSVENPFQILTAAQLMELGQHTEDYSKHFILIADIDMDPDIPGNQTFTQAVIAPSSSSNETFSGIPFAGTFDGNGHQIKNLTFMYPTFSFIGLFGKISSDGMIKNMGIVNTSVLIYYERCFLGFLAGENNGTLIHCYSTGIIERDEWSYSYHSYVGGLVGKNTGVIFDCYSSGSIMGVNSVGGLVGHNLDGYIQNCRSTCTLSNSHDYIGGLVGYNEGSSIISYCYATGSIADGGFAGGLIGYCGGNSSQYAAVNRCYATGSVLYGGGLIGYVNYCTIKNCYSTGQTESGAGLIRRWDWDVNIMNCFWDTQTSGTYSSWGGIGLTTEQMKQQQTFVDAGWDFYSTWEMIEGRTYPFFQWQEDPLENLCKDSQPFPVGDLNSDCIVDLSDFSLFVQHWMEDIRR